MAKVNSNSNLNSNKDTKFDSKSNSGPKSGSDFRARSSSGSTSSSGSGASTTLNFNPGSIPSNRINRYQRIGNGASAADTGATTPISVPRIPSTPLTPHPEYTRIRNSKAVKESLRCNLLEKFNNSTAITERNPSSGNTNGREFPSKN